MSLLLSLQCQHFHCRTVLVWLQITAKHQENDTCLLIQKSCIFKAACLNLLNLLSVSEKKNRYLWHTVVSLEMAAFFGFMKFLFNPTITFGSVSDNRLIYRIQMETHKGKNSYTQHTSHLKPTCMLSNGYKIFLLWYKIHVLKANDEWNYYTQ